ncbi:16S rRNA (adenine(1518)-N(6)/adenine(1519)-N(6))-dimethyltransferase [Candidatus Peribacteria bacterium]|mgnify:CR=1 FL=1|jgi:16S rRNA (adenine1518-N6/adenine1519-N6)-dimethyltransferase|nr:16S rRNA (adenine(1518)-N(6)/adenine(1519)-N(6))-dimethyltransferase [Candidatus Peribacteria bacterium]MBT4021651.1 16S rRNA (adenine(1518)-N(6)/adenine(1519)-N(6))-dimethyltransferase [Candidatus Peribacteria bacterium]MBT4240815.1 16S rRNA (adenine(1518)-N(6)/adenine(1519)-N(6))-dimethyltransferase [Candidatus Peribacteria bacterium]MBT4474156.1 16S rRNA (adenine(1518)-N(6)/adenine(1519)-N(6))-dimethyltransferase [Candidatus Peribacteria bacterium]
MSRVPEFCSKNGIQLNKGLGQNFLVDEAVLQKILETANIKDSDFVLEIGAGIGVLTSELVKRAGRIMAVEIDGKLVPLINKYVNTHELSSSESASGRANREAASPLVLRQAQESVEESNKLNIINANALEVDFPNEPYKIVANIPYHITSPLLRHAFLESEVYPKSMTLLIQHEVAEKICDEKSKGMLTILVGLFGKPTLIQKVPPEAFLPPPKVNSAILHIDCFDSPIATKEQIEKIFQLTKVAFGKKRKMLRNSIGEIDGGMEILEKAGIEATRRPQELSIEEWIKLANQ